jgi:hypothetical protein
MTMTKPVLRPVTWHAASKVQRRYALRLACGHTLLCDRSVGPSEHAGLAPCWACTKLKAINEHQEIEDE